MTYDAISHVADDVRSLMGGAGLTELENRLDKRLIVNRKTKKQMQRYDPM